MEWCMYKFFCWFFCDLGWDVYLIYLEKKISVKLELFFFCLEEDVGVNFIVDWDSISGCVFSIFKE